MKNLETDCSAEDEWEIEQEIAYYNSLPVIFDDFIDIPSLTDGEIELYCIAKKPAIPEKKWVPAYDFEIRRGGNRAGEINLRVGYTDGLYYGGQIGYCVEEECRGHGYAGKACRLLVPVISAHKMKKILINLQQALLMIGFLRLFLGMFILIY